MLSTAQQKTTGAWKSRKRKRTRNAETDIENGKRPLPTHIYKQDMHLYLAQSLAS